MDGVQFEEEDPITVLRPVKTKPQKDTTGIIAKIVISLGLAKNSTEAQKVLLWAAVLMICLAVGIFFIENPSVVHHPNPATLPGAI